MSNTAKFTQCEWFSALDGCIYAPVDDDCKKISTINTMNVFASEEEKANADLIATSPEMYAEIERDVRELEARLKFADKRTLGINPDVSNLKRKKALLAKARGEE